MVAAQRRHEFPESEYSGLQVKSQISLSHVATALEGGAHGAQPPQCSTVVTSVSQPSSGWLVQCAFPGSQEGPSGIMSAPPSGNPLCRSSPNQRVHPGRRKSAQQKNKR